MKKNEIYYYENLGRLEAYIELLKTGIRDICMPNCGYLKKEDLDYIDVEAKKHGFNTILVTYNRTYLDGKKFKSYQRIIFRTGLKEKAELLRNTLQKTPKCKSDHKLMGRLFGYSKEAIASFVKPKVEGKEYA